MASTLSGDRLAEWLMAHADMFPLEDPAAAAELPAWAGMVSVDVDLAQYILDIAEARLKEDPKAEEMTEEEIFKQLLSEGLITYRTKDAAGLPADGSLQDLINYIINNDPEADEAIREEARKAALTAGINYADDMTRILNDAKAAKAEAVGQANAAANRRDSIEAALWVLQDEYAYSIRKQEQLKKDYEELTKDTKATGAMRREAKKAAEDELKRAEALAESIALKQAELEAALAGIDTAMTAAEEASLEIAKVLPETARANETYAVYTDVGGAETGRAAWEGKTETSTAALEEDLLVSKLQSREDAIETLETAVKDLNDAMAALKSADAYSETSLERAAEMAERLSELAATAAAETETCLAPANERLEAAHEAFLAKAEARAEIRVAYESILEKIARTKDEAEIAALQLQADALKEPLEAADAEAAAAKAELEACQAEVDRVEALIRNADAGRAASKELTATIRNTRVDPDARRLTVAIGQVNEGGEININNEGDITVTVDSTMTVPDTVTLEDSDVTVGRMTSKRGDVTIVNKSGSILATDLDGEENVHGSVITLDARDSVGSEDSSFTVEETGHHQTKVVNAYVVDAEGRSIFSNVVGIETAQRYEEIAGAPATSLVQVIVTDSTGRRMAAQMTVKDLQDAYRPEGEQLVTFGVIDTESEEILQAGAATHAEVRIDWMRTYDETEGTELNVNARNGNIYLTERTGDVGAGEIRSAGDAVINVPSGAIATKDDRTTVAIGGEMTVNGQGDVNLVSEGDLTLNLNTGTNHVEISTSDATGAGDITVISLSTDPLTGSALSNGSVELRNKGDIGTADKAMEIDTNASAGGTATIEGRNVNVNQQAGTLLVKEIIADGDLNLTAGGSILDATQGSLEEALDRVEEAQQALTEAERAVQDADLEVYIITWDEQTTRLTEALEDARTELAEAEEANAKAQAEAVQANDELKAAKDAYRTISRDKNATAEQVVQALYRMNRAQEAADAAATEAAETAQRLATAQAELAALEADPYNKLMAAKAEIEAERAAGTDSAKLAEMLDKAIAEYRKTMPNNGEKSEQVFLRELELEQAEAHKAAAEYTIANAKNDKERTEAQASLAQSLQDIETAKAAIEQAKADTQAARDALAKAEIVRDHAAEALQIAEDALDAQVMASQAGYDLEDAETALRNADTDSEREQAQKAAETASVKKAAAEYLLTAEENLYDAYKAYTALTDGGETDEAKLQEAADKLAVARQAAAEAKNTAILANGTEAERALAKEMLSRMAKAVEAEETLAAGTDAQATVNATLAQNALSAAKQAVDAAAELKAANEAAAEAERKAEEAKAEAATAQTAVEKAEADYQAALDALATVSARDLNNARQAAANAYKALEDARTAKEEADAAIAPAEAAAEEARAAAAEAQQKADNAQLLAKAAADAADAKTAQDEAVQALADAQNEETGLDELIGQLTEAEKVLAAAQKQLDEARNDYLNGNAPGTTADEALARLAAMDRAEQALADANSEVERIAKEIEAIVADNGELEAAEQALAAATQQMNEAARALAEAEEVAKQQAQALADAEQKLADAEQALAEGKANGATDDEMLALTAAEAEAKARYENAVKADENAKKAAAAAQTAKDEAAQTAAATEA